MMLEGVNEGRNEGNGVDLSKALREGNDRMGVDMSKAFGERSERIGADDLWMPVRTVRRWRMSIGIFIGIVVGVIVERYKK